MSTKKYVIGNYAKNLAMYRATDFRVKELDFKLEGDFEKTDKVKGLINGKEIGIFTAVNNQRYIIFSDWSAKEAMLLL